MTLEELADKMFEGVAAMLQPLRKEIAALKAAEPKPGPQGAAGERGAPGERGIDGKDGAPGERGADGKDGAPGAVGERGTDGKDGAPGANGADGAAGAIGERGEAGERGMPGPVGERGADGAVGATGLTGAAGERGMNGERGEAGPIGSTGAQGVVGVAGERGIDGKDGAPGERGEMGIHGLPGPVGERGEAGPVGPVGKDGHSVTMAELNDWLEASFSKWALSVERRVFDEAQRVIANLPAAKDGKDGVSIADFEFDGERTLRCRKTDGEIVSITFPVMIDRGTYNQERGADYERGDAVSFGGSLWIAQRSTIARPGTDDSWRLAVKKGRDGK